MILVKFWFLGEGIIYIYMYIYICFNEKEIQVHYDILTSRIYSKEELTLEFVSDQSHLVRLLIDNAGVGTSLLLLT